MAAVLFGLGAVVLAFKGVRSLVDGVEPWMGWFVLGVAVLAAAAGLAALRRRPAAVRLGIAATIGAVVSDFLATAPPHLLVLLLLAAGTVLLVPVRSDGDRGDVGAAGGPAQG